MLSPLQRSGHSFTFIQVAHICSSGGGAQPLGKLRSFSPTDNCDCLDSNLPRIASHRWPESEGKRERRLDWSG